MATKAERGMKRTCQNSGCGARFYDLNRDPIECPVCGTVYNIAVSAAALAAAAAQEKAARKAASKKPAYVEPEAVVDDAAIVEDAGVLPEIEGEEAAPAEADETFLEEEEEEGDVSGIIGGVTEGEEEV
jgi:uncharacterized protein (TIGR02300 family)